MEGNRGDGTQECSSCGAHSHPRARQSSYYCSAHGLLSSLFLFLLLSHGVAVQVTSITALNARRVPTSTSFCSPHDRCEIYLDLNIAVEMSTYCRAQLFCFRSRYLSKFAEVYSQSACIFDLQLLLASIISSKYIFKLLICVIIDNQVISILLYIVCTFLNLQNHQ